MGKGVRELVPQVPCEPHLSPHMLRALLLTESHWEPVLQSRKRSHFLSLTTSWHNYPVTILPLSYNVSISEYTDHNSKRSHRQETREILVLMLIPSLSQSAIIQVPLACQRLCVLKDERGAHSVEAQTGEQVSHSAMCKRCTSGARGVQWRKWCHRKEVCQRWLHRRHTEWGVRTFHQGGFFLFIFKLFFRTVLDYRKTAKLIQGSHILHTRFLLLLRCTLVWYVCHN